LRRITFQLIDILCEFDIALRKLFDTEEKKNYYRSIQYTQG